jgi:hypothetical protein
MVSGVREIAKLAADDTTASPANLIAQRLNAIKPTAAALKMFERHSIL